ncbi:hypothetical protein BJV82DRAFT_63719 [Fennellomyces sp. T-0311]|nr:hypothetical protein BJV82DRAFT_63719 [Fennellomyces sp. T-0311]
MAVVKEKVSNFITSRFELRAYRQQYHFFTTMTMKELARTVPVDFSVLATSKSIKRYQGDKVTRPSTSTDFILSFASDFNFYRDTDYFNPTNHVSLCRTMRGDRPSKDPSSIDTPKQDELRSPSSTGSGITIVDELSSPSVDDILEDLQSLTIEKEYAPPQSHAKALKKEYVEAKRAALAKIQRPLISKWDELYEKTSLAKPPSVKQLTEEEAAVVWIMRGNWRRDFAC